jgi:urea transporter
MHAATPTEPTAVRTLLRSLGRIVLQPDAVTGACVLAALLVCDGRLACATLMRAVAANVSAALAGYDTRDTQAGLHGFNGALAGLAAFPFIADNATGPAVAILAATGTAWLLEPWSRWLRRRGLGFYSSPCLIMTWLWLPLIRPIMPVAVFPEHGVGSLSAFAHGALSGLAQTAFASGVLPGLLVLAGIAAASRRHALWALVGASVANVAHLLAGAPSSSIETGLLGFNGALTALAVADCGVGVTMAAIALSVMLQQIAGYLGLPAMTAPFVIATWSAHGFTRRRMRGGRAHVTIDLCDTPTTKPAPRSG